MAEPTTKFGLLTRLLHWAIVCLLLFQIPLAWIMIDQPLSPDKLANYALHKSTGMILFSLGVMRLVWAIVSERPPPPSDTPRYEKILAKASQGLLYLLIILMPITGWLNSSAANFPVSFFGLFTLPNLVAPNEELQKVFERSHELQSYILFGLIALHASAALRHHFLLKDNVLRSMLPMLKLK